MDNGRSYRTRDHAFGELALGLRERAGLSQQHLAALAGVSERAIQKWEAGESFPGTDSFKRLIGVYLECGVFAAGGETEEVQALWEAVPRHTSRRRKAPFDAVWFAGLLADRRREQTPGRSTVVAFPVRPTSSVPARERAPHLDWGEAPDVAAFHGRADELESLRAWVEDEQCRVIAILGLGGIGKTSIAARLARDLAARFANVFWRSLGNALPFDEWTATAISFLSDQQATMPPGPDARLLLLLDLLRERPCLLVLDNWETILRPGGATAAYRDGYEGYGLLLKRLGESPHQSCLLVTSREQPPDLGALMSATGPVRECRLRGLVEAEGRAMLQDKELKGDPASWQALVARFSGNALALRLVGETARTLFGGDIAALLAEPSAIFGDLRQILDAQYQRLASVERSILAWLVLAREPMTVGELTHDLGASVPRPAVYESLNGLLHRSLVEAYEGGAFTVQPAVLEYAADRLIEAVGAEIECGQPDLLVSHALVKARAKEFVRRSQERLIVAPILEQLIGVLGSADEIERRLLALLQAWRGRRPVQQGYGPGNVVNLLRLLRGHLRGLDLSRLVLRQAYLQEVELHDSSLAGSEVVDCALADAFEFGICVALSQDGSYLAAGTTSGELRIWRVADRAPVLAVRAHVGMIWDLALGSSVIATAGQDGAARLWDLETVRLRATLEGHEGGVRSIALSRDGPLVATGGQDGTVRLWDVGSGRSLTTLQGHAGLVQGVALSADGHLVASGGLDGTSRLWDAGRGRLLATLRGHAGEVTSVALDADGRLLASGGVDRTIRLWDAATGECQAVLIGHNHSVRGVALSSNGRRLVSGSEDQTLRVWDTDDATCLAVMRGHRGGVWRVAVGVDGRVAASGSFDGTIRLWDTAHGECQAILRGRRGIVRSIDMSANGRYVATGSYDGAVRVWDATTGTCRSTLRGGPSRVRYVALSGDGRLVAGGGGDATVRLWEVESGTLTALLQGHAERIRSIDLSGDGRVAATGSDDCTVRVWDATTGACVRVLRGHTGLVLSVSLSADGRLVASGGPDQAVRLWDVERDDSPAILEGHTDAIWGVAVSADGRRVASAAYDRTVRLWDVRTGECLATLRGHTGGVMSVAISHDGDIIASSGDDGTIRVWSADRGEYLAVLQGPGGGIWGVATSADGQVVAGAGMTDEAQVWRWADASAPLILRPDRCYQRMDISGLTGLTEAQRLTLQALGASG
jgi:WD40 repeat protein/transcriptional regulator with XRE-family HTH domain